MKDLIIMIYGIDTRIRGICKDKEFLNSNIKMLEKEWIFFLG
jgi:hypothetical protein